ncbi:MAG: diguanylate cyclase, partial [Oscillospiraceae bacterium]
LATGIVPSLGGFGWTYTNSLTNAWLWIYLVYVMLYFGVSFYFLYSWAKSVKHKLKKEMAFLFIVLDVVTILCGVVTDIILPIFNPTIPAIASIATAIFGIGYFSLIYRHDLFNINLIISSDDILQISNNALFVMDENKEILRCSPAVTTLTGFNKGELIGSNFNNLMPGYIDINELINGKDILNAEARLSCKDNTFKDVLLSASTAKDKRNSFLCIIVSCQDITKQKAVQLELEIEREKYKQLATDYQLLAYYDPLTTLANRRHFFTKLNDYAAQYHSQNEDFSVIFLDLDNFKFVNDVYGHEGGDELLMATAVKLRACISDDEFVARIGGDEFVILFHCQNVTDVETKMQLIRTEFNKDIYFNDRPYKIAISAGYDIFSQVEDMSELMQNADKAMYKNKNKLINGKIIR